MAINHYPPTVAEYAKALRVSSTRTALRYLRQLEDAGYIRRWPGARGIQWTRQPMGLPRLARIAREVRR